MDSRSKILNALIKSGKPATIPEMPTNVASPGNSLEKFKTVLRSIGGAVIGVGGHHEIRQFIDREYNKQSRILSTIPGLLEPDHTTVEGAREYENVELLIITASLAVAENGAVWITDESLPDRVLPFISQHLMVIVAVKNIVPTMHEAYDRIDGSAYEFGTFIAGPSKTADIEQSLVLGAHGPKSMTVVLVN